MAQTEAEKAFQGIADRANKPTRVNPVTGKPGIPKTGPGSIGNRGIGKYGARRPANKDRKHHGTDLAAADKSPLYAPFSGTVQVDKWDNAKGGGRISVLSDDGNTMFSAFHLSVRDLVSNDSLNFQLLSPLGPLNGAIGSHVEIGQNIGFTGSTGNASGLAGTPAAHVHISIKEKVNGAWVERNSDSWLRGN